MTKEESKLKITNLVNKFSLLDQHKIKGFNEAATKQGFIQPLFEALGWDFTDTDEVSPEDNTSNGRVDYAFKLHGVSQFYVEAKAFKEDINDPKHIKQAVSYAYNKGVTWAVLTNFQSIRVFNAQKTEPFIPLDFKQYDADFDRLWLLSKESLASGLLGQEAVKWGASPVLVPVEKHLFAQMRLWREQLFNQIFRYNEKLGLQPEQVDEIIQKLFNRLIFIRTAEDRGIEEKGLLALLHQWKTAGSKGDLLDALRQLFKEYDGYYDSELFDQKLHHLLDSPEIFVENEVIESILLGLYEIPGSMANYNFNDIDADVLGAVYEQYLGHVAEVTKQRVKEAQTKMDLGVVTQSYTLTAKKERRKEHGIYYTPKFITDYIVRETVGRFLRENAGFPDKLHNIKILDPACGSGSFLIRAYDELLRYHAKEINKPLDKLDQWERLPILTNSVFGVDLDKQAMEITRLNLLLRSLAHREPLPFLGNNIKQGNSLISGTDEELEKYFGADWKDRHPFNWQDEFSSVMDKGGFDIVIGNPPWAFTKYVDWGQELKTFIQDHYLPDYGNVKGLENQSGKINLFAVFILKGLSLLKDGGYFGFVVPNNILRTTVYSDIRRKILSSYSINQIVSLGSDVFLGVTASTVIILIRNKKPLEGHQIEIIDNHSPTSIDNQIIGHIGQSSCLDNPSFVINMFGDSNTKSLFSKMNEISVNLGSLVDIFNGIATYKDKSGISNKPNNAASKPLLLGRNIARYHYNWSGDYIDYVRENLQRPRDEKIFLAPKKLVMQRIGGILITAYDDKQFYTYNSVNNIISKNECKYSLKYLLGILNSKLRHFYYESMFTNRSTLTVNISKTFLSQLPVKSIDLNKYDGKKKHDSFVILVEKILDLYNNLQSSPEYEIDRKEQLKKEIKTVDDKMDDFVYDLYGLTEEERKIVEGQTSDNSVKV